MKKTVWASLDDYLPPFKDQKLMGRGFANYNFLEALLRYGHFDEYHFFLINKSHKTEFENNHRELLRRIDAESKVKLFYRTELPRAVSQYDYTVFHQTDHITHFNAICHFRNRFGSFPVTSFIHSISYPGMMLELQEMSFGGVTSQDAIICSSDAGQRVLMNCFLQIRQMRNLPLPPVKMDVIPFGFDSAPFAGLSREMARKQIGIGPGEIVALCFGRISEYDKMDLFPLLQAFFKIYRKDYPWRLVLAGAAHHPSYVKMVELWVKALGLEEAVIIKTDISERDKIALFKAADFFVSPSDNLQETFGLTLIEALAAGLPLVVSDFSGYREIATPKVAKRVPTRWSSIDLISSMEFGPLLDEAAMHRFMAQSVQVDMDTLSASMLELFSSQPLCARMGSAARKRFEQCYDYRLIIGRLEDLWHRLKGEFSLGAIQNNKGPLFPDYFHAFSHYFTGHVVNDELLKSTAFAMSLLDAGQDYPLFSGMDQVIEKENIRRIIAFSSEPKTLEEIIDSIGDDRGRTHYQVMWMLKHGLLESSMTH